MNERTDTSRSVREYSSGPKEMITMADLVRLNAAKKEGRRPKWFGKSRRFKVPTGISEWVRRIFGDK